MTRAQPDDCLSAGAAARRRRVPARILHRYTEEEKLPDVRSPDGRRIYRAGDLVAGLAKGARQGLSVGYARVSSCRQADGDLGGQVARLRDAAGEVTA